MHPQGKNMPVEDASVDVFIGILDMLKYLSMLNMFKKNVK